MSRYRRSLINGATYFFTLNLADRNSHLLVKEISRLRNAYGTVNKRYPFHTIAVCILPDHLHAIWTLPPDNHDYSSRWQLIKRHFSTGLPASAKRSTSKQNKREKGIWQRRFWEHQIRNELDLQRHVDYIHYNPVKHGLVERAQDWPYSSLHRYVEAGDLPLDWGGDKAKIDGEFGE
ncbi:MAG: transposase [Burkholderiales bacterium]